MTTRRAVSFSSGPLVVGTTAVLLTIAFVQLECNHLDWQELQRSYVESHPDFAPGLRMSALQHVAVETPDDMEYCVTCHLAAAGYEAVPGEPPFAEHPDVYHEPLGFGCVVCHKGDPLSVELHQDNPFGIDRPLAKDAAWVSCIHCHDPSRSPEAFRSYETLLEVHKIVTDSLLGKGCLGCHRLRGRGGVVGPALDELGKRVQCDPWLPDSSIFEMTRERLRATRPLDEAAKMPPPDLEERAANLLAAYLSLLGYIDDADQDAWIPAPPDSFADGAALYRAFCTGCHGDAGEGKERGTRPEAVPTLGSQLYARYVDRKYLVSTIREGRNGTMMEGFCPHGDDTGGDAILTVREVEQLADYIKRGALHRDPVTFVKVASGSCEWCHANSPFTYTARSHAEAAALFVKHRWDFDLERLARYEGLSLSSGPAAEARGQELYDTLCSRCHEDTSTLAGLEPASAPALRRPVGDVPVDPLFFLLNVSAGRGDAKPNKWRHQGMLTSEYSVQEVVGVLRYLEADER